LRFGRGAVGSRVVGGLLVPGGFGRVVEGMMLR